MNHFKDKVVLVTWSVLFIFLLSLGLTACGIVEDSSQAADGSQDHWIQVYFTEPKDEDDGTRQGGMDADFVRAIDAAQTSIDMALFEYDLESVTQALLAAVQRGVRVRMVVDSENWEADREMARLLRQIQKAGVQIVGDERSAFMHNKFAIFDRRRVWTGSWNLTHNGTYRNDNNALLIESSKLARNYRVEFEEMFNERSFGPRSPSNTPRSVLKIQGVRVENCFSPEDQVAERIIAKLEKAQSSICFLAFSFTHDEIGQVILDKAQDGVSVQGVFEKRGHSNEYSQYGPMRYAGLDVWPDANAYTMHHKVLIIDDEMVITGSFNFSVNASESNDENILIIQDPEVAAQYLAEFHRVYEKAQQTATATPSPAPTLPPARPATSGIALTRLTSPVSPGADATLVIQVAPGAVCDPGVIQKSGESQAQGLERKTAGGDGALSWTWRVGSRTASGEWTVYVDCEPGGRMQWPFVVQ
jgi:phosphatidylserine/phosphatidylglycerophosphate/cardiolipin synthase-like enzyme